MGRGSDEAREEGSKWHPLHLTSGDLTQPETNASLQLILAVRR